MSNVEKVYCGMIKENERIIRTCSALMLPSWSFGPSEIVLIIIMP